MHNECLFMVLLYLIRDTAPTFIFATIQVLCISGQIFITMSTDKANVSAVLVGQVECGKSTLVGRLVYEINKLPEEYWVKLAQTSKTYGRNVSIMQFYSHTSKSERERGATINIHFSNIITNTFNYTLIDVPGHRDFIKNTINGITQSDIALLIVPASNGIYETSMQKSKKCVPEGYTRIHAKLCFSYGIKQLIVLINQMDDVSVNWSFNRFTQIKTEMEKFLNKIGYNTHKIPFIPISGYKGDNVVSKSIHCMKWYNGFKVQIKKQTMTGYTLLDALNTVIRKPKRYKNKPFIMPISWLYSNNILVGKIQQGSIKIGDKIRINPCGITAKVICMQMHHKPMEIGYAGDHIAIKLDKGKYKRGEVITKENEFYSLSMARKFIATVSVQKHINGFRCKLYAANRPKSTWRRRTPVTGVTFNGFCMAMSTPMEMKVIRWKKGKSTNNVKIEQIKGNNNLLFVESLDLAQVLFIPHTPIILMPYDICKAFGRITLFQTGSGRYNSLIMIGKITSVLNDEYYEKLIYGFLRYELIKMNTDYIVNDIKALMISYIDLEFY
eukprot:28912_1